ncbi:hypothetical protein ACDX78_16730 [Virgibacillus oceani]
MNLLKRSIVVFGACIILIGAAFNTTYMISETDEGKMYEIYNEVDPDDGKHIGGEH